MENKLEIKTIPELDIKKTIKAYFKLNTSKGYQEEAVLGVMFVKFIPKFEIIKQKVSYYAIFGEIGGLLKKKMNEHGLELNSEKLYFTVKNYKKLLSKVFPDFECKDHQNDRVGHPDFKFVNKTNNKIVFYVEIKKNMDGIRAKQLEWILLNPDKEVWFLFIKDKEDAKHEFW